MSKVAGNKRKVDAGSKGAANNKKQKTVPTSVYFGNISAIKTDDLKALLSSNKITLRNTNVQRKKHFCHVVLATEDDVKKALALNGKTVGEVELKVTLSSRKDKPQALPTSELYVINVDNDEAAVVKHFSKYGKVTGVKFVGTKNAVVSFETIDAAQKALAAAGTDKYKNFKKLFVKYASMKNKTEGAAAKEDDSDDSDDDSDSDEPEPVKTPKGKSPAKAAPAKGTPAKGTPAKSPAKSPAAKRTTPTKKNTPNKKAKTSK
eukprot:TRINITY_DN67_c0_g1_i1.p1 TRINITY_DN67_c0_g1~~TRINITY_DN67_c0_g1_i1.p1  ORF type:complete len:289 (+),score=93.79 TRINITY_DN67_c0_g1_i1:83-868(+)